MFVQGMIKLDKANNKYFRKWSITYRGKPYLKIYGKKNAYDLLYRLSKYYIGLNVEPCFDELELNRKKKKESSNNESTESIAK